MGTLLRPSLIWASQLLLADFIPRRSTSLGVFPSPPPPRPTISGILSIVATMSIPNEALQKLIQEIETQAFQAQQQIGMARSQMTSKQREQRLVKLTLSEMASLPDDANVYEGVGKMFCSLPVNDLRQKLDGQTKDLEGEVEKLGKRLLYLETTHKNSREHIEQMLKGK